MTAQSQKAGGVSLADLVKARREAHSPNKAQLEAMQKAVQAAGAADTAAAAVAAGMVHRTRPIENRGFMECPECGAAPVLHIITDAVYDSDNSGGSGEVAPHWKGETHRHTYTVKDDGIMVLECPKGCMGIEGTVLDNVRDEWNGLPRFDQKDNELYRGHAPGFTAPGVYPIGHKSSVIKGHSKAAITIHKVALLNGSTIEFK